MTLIPYKKIKRLLYPIGHKRRYDRGSTLIYYLLCSCPLPDALSRRCPIPAYSQWPGLSEGFALRYSFRSMRYCLIFYHSDCHFVKVFPAKKGS